MTLKLIGGVHDGMLVEVPYIVPPNIEIPGASAGNVIAVLCRDKDPEVARYLRVGTTPFAVAL